MEEPQPGNETGLGRIPSIVSLVFFNWNHQRGDAANCCLSGVAARQQHCRSKHSHQHLSSFDSHTGRPVDNGSFAASVGCIHGIWEEPVCASGRVGS